MEKDIDVLYAEIKKENSGKNYLDILPKDFHNFKKSLIKSSIIEAIENVKYVISNSKFYNKLYINNIILYAMFYKKNHSLAVKFFDRYHAERLAPFGNQECDDFTGSIQWFTQCWDSYEYYKKVRNGSLVHSYDICKDGFPDTGRGSCCYLFTPIEGDFPANKTGVWKLYNPRSKKEEIYEIRRYKHNDNIYECINSKGKFVYFMKHQDIKNAYDALFPVNKEIYSGWWNKILISK